MRYRLSIKILMTIAALICCAPFSVHAQEILAQGSPEFQLRLSSVPSLDVNNIVFELRIIALTNKTIESSYSAFTLVNPVRLVLDIPGLNTNDKITKPLAHNLLDTLKITTFADSLRLVISFHGEAEPKYGITRVNDRELLVRFTLAEQLDQTTTTLKTNTSSGDIPANLATAKPSNSATTISAILFKAIGIPPRGAILIDINSVPQYNLTMEEENKYTLTMENTSLGSANLLLPHYAPENVDGFDTVLLEEVGKKIVVTIFTRGNVNLTPYIAQNKLWIKAIPR